MNVLVVPDPDVDMDPAVRTGQAIARWSGGAWRVLNVLGWRATDIVAAQARVKRARRSVERSADPHPVMACHRVSLRSLSPALRHEVDEHATNLVVASSIRPGVTRTWSVEDVVACAGRPVLAVRETMETPPQKIVVVVEAHDLAGDALGTILRWILALLGPDPERWAVLPIEVDVLYATEYPDDWAGASGTIATQVERCLDQPHVLFRRASAGPGALLPDSLAALRGDLVVIYQDEPGLGGGSALGRLANRVLGQSLAPVLLLPPAQVWSPGPDDGERLGMTPEHGMAS